MALAGGALPLDTFFRQDVNFAELAATWQFAETAGHRWSALVGARNLRHQYDVRLNALAQESSRKLDHDWTDALVGMTHAYPFTDSIVWRNVATVGFGESESYWSWRTALHWQVARSWNVGLYVDYRAIDYEGDDPGDPDWYLYDADEWGPGITVDYTFR
jgi:hypothetical protein